MFENSRKDNLITFSSTLHDWTHKNATKDGIVFGVGMTNVKADVAQIRI